MIARAMSAQAEFVGTVDATRDSTRPTARSLCQTQGHQRSSNAVIVPMGASGPMSREDRITTTGSVIAFIAVVVLLVVEKLA